jgi:hypothetical protein
MFIKLSFTANTRITIPLRIITDIINTSAVTSVSALQTRFTAASYNSTLTANFDAANSTIIRTVSPTSTIAHFAGLSTALYGDFEFTIEQATYDAPASKIYTQLNSATATNSGLVYYAVGNAITGGTISSSSTALSTADTGNISATKLTLGGNPLGFANTIASSSNGYDNIRTFWMYITDKGVFFAWTCGTSYNSGFGSTYADSTKFGGTFFQSQYTRYDYHNTDSNGIVPAIYSSPRGTGIGYGTAADLTSVTNMLYTSSTLAMPVRAHSIISALPQVGSSWPKIYNQYVNLTAAGRSSCVYALNQVQITGTASNATLPSYAGGISTAASTRYPSANLSSTGFGLMPFGWEASYYGNHGGNASDQSGVYLYNGDYAPGDTFSANGKVYMIWPMYSGYSNRVGFAVPME